MHRVRCTGFDAGACSRDVRASGDGFDAHRPQTGTDARSTDAQAADGTGVLA
jgi:hypothetical protein